MGSADFSILKARIDALERQIEGVERMVGTLLIFLYMHELVSDDEFGRVIERYLDKRHPEEIPK